MDFLTAPLLKEIPWISHGFFTRKGGVSQGIFSSLNAGYGSGDLIENVAENRRRISIATGVHPDNLLAAKQVHGDKTLFVVAPWTPENAPEADAMATTEKGLALGILTADCVPILLASSKEKIIGAAHAGWRGALGGIIPSVLSAMEKRGATPEDLYAVIGPCIGPASYEVQDDLRDEFLKKNAENTGFFHETGRAGRFLFNLPAFIAAELHAGGVHKIHDLQQDTFLNAESFFSNRRAFKAGEKNFGRLMSVIAIKP